MKLHLDFETRSWVDLKKVGAWAYAMHPSTEITCMGYGTNSQDIVTRGRGYFGPHTLPPSGMLNAVISAHNATFEYAIYNYILHKRYGWPALWNPERWSCTMARALMCGLPASLDELTRVLGCKTPKDLDGRRVMLQLSKPTGYDALGDPIYDETPAKYERLYAYNKTDVMAEMEVDNMLPELPPSERKIWELDLTMNHRGIAVDIEFCKAAAKMSDSMMGPINAEMKVKSGGAIDKATQIKAIKDYLVTNKVEIPYTYVDGEKKDRLDKVGVTELLARPEIPANVRRVIELRRQATKTTSTAKYAKAIEMVCPDGRIRGNSQYYGAHTGRWAGRLLQAHNFPQGFDEAAQLDAIDFIRQLDAEAFQMVYGDKCMDALSDALRGMIVAPANRVLASADFRSIEACVVFWLAGEEGALATYRKGGSPYLDMGAYIYKRPITKKGDPKEYDISKRTVLGCGFGMGWEKFRDNIYAETAKRGNPTRVSDDLAKLAVNGYREFYPGVPRLWKETESAAVLAVQNPGQSYAAANGRLLYHMSRCRRWLVCRLPSGRYMWYWKPEVKLAKTPWGAEKQTLFYWGLDTGQWTQLKTYGGLLTENPVQAIARDIMAHGMLAVNGQGFDMELTVHDELLAEADDDGRDPDDVLKAFIKLMCATPDWAAGLPVAAEGWVGKRYRK